MKTFNINQTSRVMLLSAVIFFSTSFLAQAAGLVTGRIVDVSNEPVNYATATLINPQTGEIVKGDMSDDSGEFIIEHVQPGEYILSVRNLGHETDETLSVNVEDGMNSLVVKPIVLKEAVVELPEVVVTGKAASNMHLTRASDKPASNKANKL